MMGIKKSAIEKLISERIKREVKPGEFIELEPDIILGNDITAPLAIKEIYSLKINKLKQPEKIVLIPDHFLPARDIEAANAAKLLREFSLDFKINNYFEVGRVGIEHAFLPDEGFIKPGDIIVGADSHTTTYGALATLSFGIGSTDLLSAMLISKVWLKVPEIGLCYLYGKPPEWVSGKDIILRILSDIKSSFAGTVIEFKGESLKYLGISDRFTIANMSTEASALGAWFDVDETTISYLEEKGIRDYKIYSTDPNYDYAWKREYRIDKLVPQVAAPHSPYNASNIEKFKEIRIDQGFVGSCTNGRIEDLRIVAKLLKGKSIAKSVRFIVIPATPKIYLQALKEGIIESIVAAGGVVSPPTCGPCLGGHMGVLGEKERAIASTNRNFKGRMGALSSEVYLASPAVVTASAILGRIGHPAEVS